MGMQMARDVRSANLAQADRAERRQYRASTEKRSERELEIREEESDVRIRGLKRGMRRGRKAEKRSERELVLKESADTRAERLAVIQEQLYEQRRADAENPIIADLEHKAGVLERYSKMQKAADKRHAVKMGPLNAVVRVAERTKSPDLLNLIAIRDTAVKEHEEYKAGLEQAFRSSSNQPHEGKWSVRPYHDAFNGKISYGFVFENASGPEAKAALNAIKSMGGTVGMSPGATPATTAQPLNPLDPLGIRQPPTPPAP